MRTSICLESWNLAGESSLVVYSTPAVMREADRKQRVPRAIKKRRSNLAGRIFSCVAVEALPVRLCGDRIDSRGVEYLYEVVDAQGKAIKKSGNFTIAGYLNGVHANTFAADPTTTTSVKFHDWIGFSIDADHPFTQEANLYSSRIQTFNVTPGRTNSPPLRQAQGRLCRKGRDKGGARSKLERAETLLPVP